MKPLDPSGISIDSYVSLLRALVEHESPTGDETRLGTLADRLQEELARRGGAVERRSAPGFGEHLIARFASSQPGGAPLLIIGHMDTVHPLGTLAELPFEVADGRIRGPGTYDMKGGIAVVLEAMDLLASRGEEFAGDVVVLLTCEEEVGSPQSRPLIEELARSARGALVVEPSVPGGGVKAQRKGVAGYELRVTGRAAHAGIEPEAGASAVVELAHQILALEAEQDLKLGTTINLGVISGGTKSNVVPAESWADVDVRFWTREEADRVDAAIRGLQPLDPRCTLAVEGGVNRYALERTPASDRMAQRAVDMAADFGFELAVGRSGGASDGNLASAVGCPTLDGLGPDGGGAHSLEEHILVADIPRRIALMSGLLRAL